MGRRKLPEGWERIDRGWYRWPDIATVSHEIDGWYGWLARDGAGYAAGTQSPLGPYPSMREAIAAVEQAAQTETED